jgi:hypothetical protein
VLFEQTKNLLEVNYQDGTQTIFYTFKAPNFVEANYFHVLERKEYYLVGCYSGDEIKYYKNENKIEYINTVTKEVTILHDRTYRIYEDVEQ